MIPSLKSEWYMYLWLIYNKIFTAFIKFVCNYCRNVRFLDNKSGIKAALISDSRNHQQSAAGIRKERTHLRCRASRNGHQKVLTRSNSICQGSHNRPSKQNQHSNCVAKHPGQKSQYYHCIRRHSNADIRRITMAPGATVQSMLEDKEKVLKANKLMSMGLRCPDNQFAPLLIALVGLPARGKSQVAHRLTRHLNWNGESTKVFECSEYRRKHMEMYASHDIFREDNQQGSAIRRQSAREAVQDAIMWLKEGNSVAVFDGTNINRQQREELNQYVLTELGFRIMFIECVCEDQELLEKNIIEILRYSEDYKHMTATEACDDLRKKLQHYMRQYEPIDPSVEAISFVKVINCGETLTAHRVVGQKESGILGYLSGMKPMPQTLYFSRHGESEYNILGKIGGDANLSPRGYQYADALSKHINELAQHERIQVWTSELRRTKQTAQDILAPKLEIRALNELDAGICEGLTYEEMQERFPQEFAWRDQDKLRYRYPWGESYIDIMTRLRPVLSALEDLDNVVVVGHQAILRCVLGYFLDAKLDELPYMNVPLHTIVKLTSHGYKYTVEMMKLGVECVDTHRKQPKNCSINRSSDDALVTVPSHYDTLPSTLWQNANGTAAAAAAAL